MLVQSFFDKLTYGELAQISIGGADEEGVVDEVIPNVVSHINLGLLDLSIKFNLNTKRVNIQEYSTVTLYRLHSDFSVNSASAEPVKYIEDTPDDLFSDDVLKIEQFEDVSDEANIKLIPYNVLSNPDAIITRSSTSFYIPTADTLRTIRVTFRATVPELDADTLDPDVDLIDVPAPLVTPLLYYVASRIHANRPTVDGQENTSLKYMQMYDKTVEELRGNDITLEEEFENERLENNGWL